MYKKVLVVVALISCGSIQARESKRRPIKEVSVISEEKTAHYNVNMSGVPFGKEFEASGSCYLHDFKTKKMTIVGDAAIEDSIVTYESYISGELAAHKTTFGGLVNVSGPVAASMSRFKDKLIADGSVLLINTTTQDVVVENHLGQDGQVYLQGKTTVYGSIVFKSGSGKVYANRSSKIQGTIVGGTLYRQ